MKHGNTGNRNAAHTEPADSHLHVRCNAEHKHAWQAAAREAGQTFSRWVSDTLNRSTRR